MHKIRQFKEKTIDLIIYWSFLAQINWRGDQFDRSDPSTDLILIIMMETNPFTASHGSIAKLIFFNWIELLLPLVQGFSGQRGKRFVLLYKKNQWFKQPSTMELLNYKCC